MNKSKSIQIIGTQRSGSNLLRVMLNQINEVDAPHPPHILKRFFPLLPKYGNLNIESNFDKLVEDVCKMVELNPVPWENFSLNRETLKSKCHSNSLIEIYRVIYELKATNSKATYWCCKSMSNIHFSNEIEKANIKPLYIHLYRDGRDVALSFKKAIVGQKHMYHIAKQWRSEQELCLKLKETLGDNRVFQVSYESLLTDSEAVLKRLCDFLKVSYSAEMLDYYKSNESSKTADSGKMWSNLSQPVIKNNFNKFSKELSPEDIEVFERIAGDTLLKLGYNLSTSTHENLSAFTASEIEQFDKINRVLKTLAIKNASEKDIEKREGQSNLLQLIKKV